MYSFQSLTIILLFYCTEPLKSVFMHDPYKLKSDEEWPEEVAHLFGNKREGEEDVKGKLDLQTHITQTQTKLSKN